MIGAWANGLRAEALRLSRRWDVWLSATLFIVAAAVLYLGAFRDATAVMGIGDPGSWGPVPDAPPPEPWFVDAMLSLRAPYAFPASFVTVLDTAWLIPIVGAYVALVTIGADFGWGTLRTILIARPSRRTYLLQRFVTVAVLATAGLLGLLVIALLAQAGLPLVGERFPEGQTSAGAFGAILGTRFLAALAWAAVATALTVLARSIVGGLALTGTFALVDAGLRAIPGEGPLGLVRDVSLSGSIAAVIDRLRPAPVSLVVDYNVGGLVPSPNQLAQPAHMISPEGAAVVLMAWLVGALALALWRVERMDVLD